MIKEKITKFVADDGTSFDREEDCIDYEGMCNMVGKYCNVEIFMGAYAGTCKGVARISGVGHCGCKYEMLAHVLMLKPKGLDRTYRGGIKLKEIIREIPPKEVDDAIKELYQDYFMERLDEDIIYLSKGSAKLEGLL